MAKSNWLSKSYKDEIHIVDGIIISLLLIVFIFEHFDTLMRIYFVDLILLIFMLITIFFITVLTIKNVLWHVDEMQVSFCFTTAVFLTLFNYFFFTGIIAYWFFFAYFIVFSGVFVRNLVLKVFYDEKKIMW